MIRIINRLYHNIENKRKYELSLQVAIFLGASTLAVLALLIQPGVNLVFCIMASDNQNSSKTPLSPFCDFVIGLGETGSVQSSSWLDYKQLLIGGVAIVGTLFVVSIYGMKRALVRAELDDSFAKFSHLFYEIGFIGFLVLFPLLVMPFSVLGFLILIFITAWGIIRAHRDIKHWRSLRNKKRTDDYDRLNW